jgi:hypothetical protein
MPVSAAASSGRPVCRFVIMPPVAWGHFRLLCAKEVGSWDIWPIA